MGWLEEALRVLVGDDTPVEMPSGAKRRLKNAGVSEDMLGPQSYQQGIPMPGAGALGGATRSAIGKLGSAATRTGRAASGAGSAASRGVRAANQISPKTMGASAGTVLGGGITAAGLSGNPSQVSYPGESAGLAPDDPLTGGERFAEQRRLRAEREAQGDMDIRYSEGAHKTPQQAAYPGESYGLDPQGNPVQGVQGQGMGDFNYEDPYAEFLDSHYNQLSGAFDSQIDAIAGLEGVSRDLANESQENIGGFWDYAGNVAREGIPVTEEIYDTATSNVNQIRDDVGGRLENMPNTITDLATSAAGGGVSNTVAERTAAATAPFLAANESGRAATVSNLASSSAAGQNYLNQLAGATGGEGAMHQTHVQGALDQQLQQIAYRQAELEGAKQRALSDVSADIAGHSAERMGNAALAHALGLDLPGEGAVDPMQYLQGQGMMNELAGGQGGTESMSPKEQVDLQRAMINLQSDELDLQNQLNPNLEAEQIMSQMSPSGQKAFSTVQQAAESNFDFQNNDPRDIGFTMLDFLEDMASGEKLPEEDPLRPFLERNRVSPGTMEPGYEDEVREGIRRLYGLG